MIDKRKVIYFTAPGVVGLEEMPLAHPAPGELLVQTLLSGISAGTEMLIYRGQFPENLVVDTTIQDLAGEFSYPLSYGYCLVGRVVEIGAQVDPVWLGRSVFAFHPHASAFLAKAEALVPIPMGIQPQDAVFFPNMETAVNLVMDGRPLLGEEVVVFGQGVVGLLTTALLGWFPLRRLVTLDPYPLRREWSLQLGAHASLDPEALQGNLWAEVDLPAGADLVYELSGVPETLDSAILAAGFAGRVVVGSWYGKKRASLDLGGYFHRSRLRLISSQVSTLAPELSGRWTKQRRYQVAWEMIRRLHPSRLTTQLFPFDRAAEAYQLLDKRPEQTIQVLLEYDGGPKMEDR